MSELESILDGAINPEVEQPEAQETQETSEQPEDSTDEQIETAGEKNEQEPTPDPENTEKQDTVVPLQALMAERDKKRKLEQELEQLRSQKEPEKAPDVFDDQEAYTKHMQKEISTQAFNIKAEMSEYLARRDHPDLDKDIETFKELAKENPALSQQIYAAASPYHEIHDIVDKHNRYQDMQNVDQLEARLRTELEEKIRAEFENKAKSKEELRSSVPTSLVGETSQGDPSKLPSKPTSLSSILGD